MFLEEKNVITKHHMTGWVGKREEREREKEKQCPCPNTRNEKSWMGGDKGPFFFDQVKRKKKKKMEQKKKNKRESEEDDKMCAEPIYKKKTG